MERARGERCSLTGTNALCRALKNCVGHLTALASRSMLFATLMKTCTLSIHPMFRASETGRGCVHYLPAWDNQEQVK
jgi:hypothetical protein